MSNNDPVTELFKVAGIFIVFLAAFWGLVYTIENLP